MAAVFFKYTTAKGKGSQKDYSSGQRRKVVDEFLTGKGWRSIGSQAFHSEPSSGTVREQMVSQARAICDIEELLKWKPTLKDYLKDSLLMVGQVYDIDSLMESSTAVKTHSRKDGNVKRPSLLEVHSSQYDSPFVWKDCALNGGTKKSSIANAMKAIKLGQPKIKSPVGQKLKNTTRPARVRPMGSAAKATSHPIVNFPRAPVKTTKGKGNTTLLIRSSHSRSDVNSNLLSGVGGDKNEGIDDEDDMTPLYLTCLEEDSDHGGKEATHDSARVNSYHVETFVTRDVCTKKLCCPNVNMDPSERVVV